MSTKASKYRVFTSILYGAGQARRQIVYKVISDTQEFFVARIHHRTLDKDYKTEVREVPFQYLPYLIQVSIFYRTYTIPVFTVLVIIRTQQGVLVSKTMYHVIPIKSPTHVSAYSLCICNRALNQAPRHVIAGFCTITQVLAGQSFSAHCKTSSVRRVGVCV